MDNALSIFFLLYPALRGQGVAHPTMSFGKLIVDLSDNE